MTRGRSARPETAAPPNSERCERDALACLLLGDNPGEVLGKLKLADFYDLRHRAIFGVAQTLAAQARPVNGVTVGEAVIADKRLAARCGGLVYVAGLPDQLSGGRNLDCYLAELRGYTARRQLLQMADKAREFAVDPDSDPGQLKRELAEHAQTLLERDLGRKVPVVSIGAIQTPTRDDPAELLRHRFLCRGGGLLLCGPTGIGKSSLLVQSLLSWAVGKPCLGFTPARPLKSLLIQAENDPGDLAQMRDGILDGLHFSKEECARALAGVLVATVDDSTGPEFISRDLAPLVEAHSPDILGLDPLLAYLGGDVSKQEVLSRFLRECLNPLLHTNNCGCIVCHHTNKPPSGREKPDWKAGDFAYIGAGSAELANWACGVIALRAIGDHDVFELVAGKRGTRLDWRGPDGTKIYLRHVAHSKEPGVIYWREPDAAEIPSIGRPQTATPAELADLLRQDQLVTSDWQTAAGQELGVSRALFFRLKKQAIEQRLVEQSKLNKKWFVRP